MQKVKATNMQKVHVTENGIGPVFDFETKFALIISLQLKIPHFILQILACRPTTKQ